MLDQLKVFKDQLDATTWERVIKTEIREPGTSQIVNCSVRARLADLQIKARAVRREPHCDAVGLTADSALIADPSLG
jgi:hypothetical protein